MEFRDGEFIGRMMEDLRAHRRARPAGTARDAVKFVFQGMLGVGHLLPDPDRARAYAETEMAGLSPDGEEALTEALSPAWCRLNLRPAKALGLTPEQVSRLMLRSDREPRPAFSREDVRDVCLRMGEYPAEEIRRETERIGEPDWLPSHSPEYREAYRPAYRVISSAYRKWLPALGRAAELAARGGRTLLTIDGPCASGKTTAAAFLADILGASVLHTDDFVVPHARKTAERLAVPGGNCDWERLTEETLRPWKTGGTPVVRRYDCRADALRPPETLPESGLLILEGSYCGLPAIRELADLRFFTRTPESTRRARLEKRESAASLAQFDARWIPLENAYFAAYRLPDPDCVILPGSDEPDSAD